MDTKFNGTTVETNGVRTIAGGGTGATTAAGALTALGAAANTAFTGATSSAAGTAGLVPAPIAGDHTKVLRADGTWQQLPDPGFTIAMALAL
jgi:hypothetical protein